MIKQDHVKALETVIAYQIFASKNFGDQDRSVGTAYLMKARCYIKLNQKQLVPERQLVNHLSGNEYL